MHATLHNRYDDLRRRVVEHNIRVMSKYYSCIKMDRLSALLELPQAQVEEFLSELVVNKTVYAKMDRSVITNKLIFFFGHHTTALLHLQLCLWHPIICSSLNKSRGSTQPLPCMLTCEFDMTSLLALLSHTTGRRGLSASDSRKIRPQSCRNGLQRPQS